MNDFAQALEKAASLIGHFDVELREIVFLSLRVSLTASFLAFAVGAPLARRPVDHLSGVPRASRQRASTLDHRGSITLASSPSMSPPP